MGRNSTFENYFPQHSVLSYNTYLEQRTHDQARLLNQLSCIIFFIGKRWCKLPWIVFLLTSTWSLIRRLISGCGYHKCDITLFLKFQLHSITVWTSYKMVVDNFGSLFTSCPKTQCKQQWLIRIAMLAQKN